MRKKVNTAQAAEYLGLRPNTLEIWRCRNKGPRYMKFGRRVLYDLGDLEEFVRSCTVQTVEDFFSPRILWKTQGGGKTDEPHV